MLATDEIAFDRVVAAARRRWPLLAAGAVAGAVALGSFALSRPVVYEAVATLLIVAPAKTPGVPVSPPVYEAMIGSGALASQVVEELGLGQAPHEYTGTSFLENAVRTETLGTNVLKLRVRLREPRLAVEAGNRLARKAVDLSRRLNAAEGSAVQEQLREHLTAATEKLAAAEQALVSFQQSAQVELLKEDTDAMLEERGDLLRLTVAIESEKARLSAAETEIARQDRVLNVPRAVDVEASLRRADRVAVDAVEREEAARAQEKEQQREKEREADKKPEPRPRPRPRGEIGRPDDEVVDLTGPYLNPVYQTLDYQIATSRARLAALEQERRQLVDVRHLGGDGLERLRELYSRQVELGRLQTAADLAKRIHSDLLVRYEESRTATVGTTPQLLLVDEAVTPDKPVSRRVVLLSAIGFATGLLGCWFVAAMLESRGGAGA